MAAFAWSRFSRRFGWLTLGVSALFLTACSDPKVPPRSQSAQTQTLTPEELLTKLRTTYAAAKSYSDNATLVERGVSRSRGSLTEIPFTHLSLLFARPNRYAISYEDAIPSSQGTTKYRVVSDGQRIRSAASELPEQIHEAIAPRETTTDNLIPEPELRQAILQVAIENLFPQLAMLLAHDAEKPIFPRASHTEMLPEQTIGAVLCYRVAMTEPEGKRILWIDKEKLILRRMEIPIEGQREILDPTKQFSSFSVDLDLEDVTLDPEFDDAAVTLVVPETGRLVRRFVPPAPEGPSEDLGKPVKEFAFTDVAGTKVTPASLAGKVCVLDFWKTDCPPCKANTPELEAAFQEFKDAEDVAFYGVSTDPKGLDTKAVEKTLQAWGATFPVLRDLDKNVFYDLGVQATPTLMLVGPDGRLLSRRVGMLESGDELVKKIRQIQAGEDLVLEAKDQHAKQLEQHEAILQAATLKNSLVGEQGPAAEIKTRKLPEDLKVEQLWKAKLTNLSKPGDVAVLTTLRGEPQEILVLDNGQTVVRYDNEGRQLGRVELPSHEEQQHGFIRTAVDAAGARWFLVSGVGWQQVFLYDKDWKLLFAFPDEPHSGVGDARFFDLKSSGVPTMLVGYRGGRGVQAGTLEGQRMWVNRHLDHVLQVAAGPLAESSDQSLWCTSTRGTVFEISAEGKSQQEFAVVGHTMVALAVATQAGQHCGISLIKPGQYALVAFNDKGDVSWSYELPPGEYAGPIPPIQAIHHSAYDDYRVVAGPDGSLHFVGEDGKLIDRFDYGDAIAGLATVSSKDGTILFVSADNRLTAWRLTSFQKEAKSAP